MASIDQRTYLSLADLKTWLHIESTTDDAALRRIANSACRQVERFCDRKFRRRRYTEYHDGDGLSGRITLQEYPITTVHLLYDDPDRDFASTSVVSTDDWTYAPGRGRSPGYIELFGGEVSGTTGRVVAGHLYFKKGVRNLKTEYTAGYAEFRVDTGVNDKINFLEEDGGSEVTATLVEGEYEADEVETEVKRALDAAGGATYTVTYGDTTNKFTISSSSDFLTLKWNSGSNTDVGAHGLLGFSASADDTGATSYAGDDPVGSVPDDLLEATIELAALHVKRSGLETAGIDASRIGLRSANQDGASVSFDTSRLPDYIKEMLIPYQRLSFF